MKNMLCRVPISHYSGTYVREIVDNLPYNIKMRDQRASVRSSSQYYILKHANLYIKNNLAITNRMFQKYTFPQNQFNN